MIEQNRQAGHLQRRKLGTAALAIGAVAAVVTTGSTPAKAQAATDTDILNFALNFEYLGAELYLRALTGQGLASADVTGTGTQGTVTGGSQVLFRSDAIRQYCQRLAVDELGRVVI